MIGWIKRLLGSEPRLVYVVQLEVHDRHGEVVSSFAAVTTHSLQEALGWAAQLERDNRWASEDAYPVVQLRTAA